MITCPNCGHSHWDKRDCKRCELGIEAAGCEEEGKLGSLVVDDGFLRLFLC